MADKRVWDSMGYDNWLRDFRDSWTHYKEEEEAKKRAYSGELERALKERAQPANAWLSVSPFDSPPTPSRPSDFED